MSINKYKIPIDFRQLQKLLISAFSYCAIGKCLYKDIISYIFSTL